MTTKQYLGQIERMDRMIQNKLSEIQQLQCMAMSVTIAPKEVNIQVSPDIDKMGTVVSKLVDLEKETAKLIDDYIYKRQHIINQIDNMNDTNVYHVLSEKYIAKKDLNVIAVEMGYSFKQVCRIHGKGILEFERIYGSEYLKQKVVPKCP